MSEYVPPEYDRHNGFDPDVIHAGKGQTGDVCPWCGEPIQVTEDIVDARGTRQDDIDLWADRVYHEDCYESALTEKRKDENTSLGDYADE